MGALLIAGDGKDFLDAVVVFAEYLKNEVSLQNIRVLDGVHDSAVDVKNVIRTVLGDCVDPEPHLLLYCGHSTRHGDGWHLRDGEMLYYPELVGILADCGRPLMFVNDCCFAQRVVAVCEERSISPDTTSFIAAAKSGGTTDETETDSARLTWRVMQSWQRGVMHVAMVREVETISFAAAPQTWKTRLEDARCGISERLNKRFPRVFSTIYCGTMLSMESTINSSMVRDPDERWGVVLDHHFFPKRETLARYENPSEP